MALDDHSRRRARTSSAVKDEENRSRGVEVEARRPDVGESPQLLDSAPTSGRQHGYEPSTCREQKSEARPPPRPIDGLHLQEAGTAHCGAAIACWGPNSAASNASTVDDAHVGSRPASRRCTCRAVYATPLPRDS